MLFHQPADNFYKELVNNYKLLSLKLFFNIKNLDNLVLIKYLLIL